MTKSSSQNIVFLCGAAFGGKTQFAQDVAEKFARPIYVGNMQILDKGSEMSSRIEALRKKRAPHILTIEPPTSVLEYADVVKKEKADLLVFDCVTLWLAWELNHSILKYSKPQHRSHLEKECSHLLEIFKSLPCPVLIVSNEIGSGVVPQDSTGRLFREFLGLLNQQCASISKSCIEMRYGIPLLIKHSTPGSSSAAEPVLRISADWLKSNFA